jgi:hypothetical protein
MSESTTYENHGLVIRFDRKEPDVTLTFEGVSDAPDPDAFLTPLLEELGKKCKAAAVTVDFRGLTYMNSATVAPLIGFMKDLDGLAKSTVLIWDGRKQWQRVNCKCMQTVSRTLSTVKVEER